MEFRDLKKQYLNNKALFDGVMQEVCESSAFIGGTHVKELEKALAEYVGVKHCISCANGTDALQLALMTWKVGPGDVVFVPDFTYFSSAEVVSTMGATPIFVDVDQHTYNVDPVKLEQAIEIIKHEGKYNLKAVIAVDLFGLPANYEQIRPICEKYGMYLLEDGAQGFGGKINLLDGNDKHSCSFGDISTTSFFPAKPLGCYGDGGAVFTDNDEWAELIRSYAVHGKGDSKYDNVCIGMNSRLDNLQAAILQIKFDMFKGDGGELETINRVANMYTDLFKREGALDKGIVLPAVPYRYLSSWAQYTIQLPCYFGTRGRADLQKYLKDNGIPSMIYYIKPMHKQKAYEYTDSATVECPVSTSICDRVLSLPIDSYKTSDELRKVVYHVMNYLGKQVNVEF